MKDLSMKVETHFCNLFTDIINLGEFTSIILFVVQ